MKKIIMLSAVFLMAACQDNQEVQVTETAPAAPVAEVAPVAKVEKAVAATPKISVQLWSVRHDVKRDFEGTLKALADMGFDGIEFAGDFGPYQNDAEGLKTFLDSLGLVVSGAHINFELFSGDNLASSVAFYQALGTDMLMIGGDPRSADVEKIDELNEDLIKLSENLAPYGIKGGFHNHAKEFNAYKDTTFWDHIATSTPESSILQLDIGWVTYADKNPVEYINKYPGRTLTSHFKPKLPKGITEGDKLPLIGQGVIDWASIIQAEMAVGGTRWFVVEQEDYPNGLTPLEAVKISKDGLDKIITSTSTH